MALRNGSPKIISRFQGHNSTDNLENVAADFWSDSLNVLVNSRGSAEVMYSPKAFNATEGTTNPVLSMAAYINPSEERLLFDLNTSSGNNVATYKIENDFSNTSLRTGQHNVPFVSLVINFQLYRLSTHEFIQHTAPSTGFASWDVFAVGVAPPAAAPTIAYVGSGGSGQILDSIQVSYAYMNSRTGEVSKPCPASNILGASAANDQVAIPVIASAQHGVDKLVFFFTLDGGSQPFLLIDSSGDPVTQTNASTTYDFDIGTLAYDTLTPEPLFNDVAPAGAAFMFQWKEKIFLMGFDGTAVPANNVAYSGLESCYIGIPQSCYPPLNQLGIGAKGETMTGGISTQLGALLCSDFDSYLLTGFPDDKTSGPEATTAVSEVVTPLNWRVGTISPKTMQNTPYGTMWLDQTARIRIWTGSGFPSEAGLPLRAQLDLLDKTDLANCEAQWFQFGDDGGIYALTGKIAATGKRQLFLISMYQDPASGAQMSGFAISSIEAQSLVPMFDAGDLVLFMGGIDRVFTIMFTDHIAQQSHYAVDSSWPMGTKIFFEMTVGNENNYQYWHSLHFDADIDLSKLTVTVRDVVKNSDGETVAADISTARTLTPEFGDEGDGTAYTLIDEYGRRKVIRFAFDPTDELRNITSGSESGSDFDHEVTPPQRRIKNVRVMFANKKRLL